MSSQNASLTTPYPWQAAIVDLDGTLVDTLGDFELALNRSLAELGLSGVDRAFIEHTVGKGSAHLLRSTLGQELPLPDAVWRRLNFAWIAFFALMGLVNLWVAYSFDTAIWVDFKLFGATGLMLLFMVAQGVYISRHLPEGEGGDTDSRKSLP